MKKTILLLCGCVWSLMAAAAPVPIQAPVAESFGRLYVEYNGALCRIWQDADGWYDINDAGSNEALGNDERLFQMYALQYVAADLAHGNNIEANETLKKIWEYQKQHFRDLPDEWRFAAEQAWVTFGYTLPLALVCLAVSIMLLMMNYELRMKNYALVLRWFIAVVCVLLWAFLTAMLVWRWYISGHVPMSNGHETMQFLAWVCLLIASTLCITSRRPRNKQPETCNLKPLIPPRAACCWWRGWRCW